MYHYSITFIMTTKARAPLRVKPIRARVRRAQRELFRTCDPNQMGFRMRVIEPGLQKFEIKIETDLT